VIVSRSLELSSKCNSVLTASPILRKHSETECATAAAIVTLTAELHDNEASTYLMSAVESDW
jgi:hypothetical protein